MTEKFLFKLGYYSIYETKLNNKTTYKVDSGKMIYIDRLKKTINNPYRDVKVFDTIEKAKIYILKKINEKKVIKKPKMTLYLVLIKEEKTSKTFVKVGITSKRFVHRRFSKKYGYDGYNIESILRKIETENAEILEEKIKIELNKRRSVKKYRPILESFSGYSECYDILSLDDITNVFDKIVNKII